MTNKEAINVLKTADGIYRLVVLTCNSDAKIQLTEFCAKFSEACELACVALDDLVMEDNPNDRRGKDDTGN